MREASDSAFGSIGWCVLAVSAAILVFQALVPPAIGLADNGDFQKILGPLALQPPVEDIRETAFRYIHLHYDIVPADAVATGFHSSEALLIRAAMRLNRLISPSDVFDLRVLGAIHAALFLLALSLLISLTGGLRAGPRVVLLALAALVLCDVAYSAYYNSFYMDAGAFLFLMLSIVTVLRAVARRRTIDTCVALVCCLLLVTAKSQHALLAIPLAVFMFWERHALWPRRALLGSSLAATCLLCGATYELTLGSPRGYTNPCLFSAIFERLLPTATDPARELADLGLDRSYLRYGGTDAFDDRSPMNDVQWVRAFMSRTSFQRLAGFYATHPGRTLRVAKMALGEAALGRAPLGNYEQSAGRPPYTKSRTFAVWSTLRRTVLGRSVWLYPLIFAASVGVIVWRFAAAGIALGLMGLIEFAVGGMTEASEVTRHLFLWNTLWDVSLLGAAATLVVAWIRRTEHKQTK